MFLQHGHDISILLLLGLHTYILRYMAKSSRSNKNKSVLILVSRIIAYDAARSLLLLIEGADRQTDGQTDSVPLH